MSADAEGLTPEQRRLLLEERKLQLDEQRAAAERRFVHRNSAAIIAAIISLGTISVSYLQLRNSQAQKEAEMEETRNRNNAQIAQQKLDSDRGWSLRLAEFMVGNSETLFGPDSVKRDNLRRVMQVAFPPEVTRPVFDNLEATSRTSSAQTTWTQAVMQTDTIIARRRARLIEDMFDASPPTRIGATVALSRDYGGDPLLVPEVIAFADAGRGEDPANGVYNSLVLFQELDPVLLRQYRTDLCRYTETDRVRGNGRERTAEQADRLRRQLDPGC